MLRNKLNRLNSLLLAALLWVTAPLPVALFAGQPAPKPQSPLHVQLQAEAPLLFDAVNTFIVTLSSTVDLADVKLQLTEAYLRSCSGQTQWSGPVAAWRELSFQIRCFVPRNASGFLEVQATGQINDGASSVASSIFPLGAPTAKALSLSNNSRLVDDNGRNLREYTLP